MLRARFSATTSGAVVILTHGHWSRGVRVVAVRCRSGSWDELDTSRPIGISPG